MNLYHCNDKSLEDPFLASYADITYYERYAPEEEDEGTFEGVWERWDD